MRTIICKNNVTLLMIATLFITPSVAMASNQFTQHLKMVGQGEMSWLFIDLYQAALFSPNGKYKHKEYPQALNITYQKDIDKNNLVSATEKEWQKLSLNNPQFALNEGLHSDWLAQLTLIWPNIKKGDQLLFIVENDGLGYFYHNNLLLGGINSDKFSADFLSIWLSKNTSEPALRKQLLGE